MASLASCFGCFKNNDDDGGDDENPLMWSKDHERFSFGHFSFAVFQANEVMEDHSQVETGLNDCIFVGIYDGHGGEHASRFINNQLFDNLLRIAKEKGNISEGTLRSAIRATEDGYFAEVERVYPVEPMIATIGSCCLVGFIWKGKLIIANVGDSRAVIGYTGPSNRIIAEQLTIDHNANRLEIREELKSFHRQDPNIVFFNNGAWRVKGILQVTRSIGDVYMKKPGFSVDDPRFRLREPISEPILRAEPFVGSRVLRPNDRFIIFASDGLWTHVTSQEAVEIVHKNPEEGIARRLVKAALKVAAKKSNMKYKELQKIKKGTRRDYHDDITVIVVFINHDLIGQNFAIAESSYKGFNNKIERSNFQNIWELM